VTLGVADVARATDFYRGLGWRRSAASNEQISFFDLGAVVLGLSPRPALAEVAHNRGFPLDEHRRVVLP
jgi:hypothetical protein